LQATAQGDEARLRGLGFGTAEPELRAAFAGMSSVEGVSKLRGAGIAAVPVWRKFREFHEATASARAEEAMVEITLSGGGKVWAAGRYARFGRTPVQGHHSPPGLGEHTREVLREAGLGKDEIEALVASGDAVVGRGFTVAGAE
jgi:crotonobetainyl-CoA:carnitine CoA-transferase CaiB-like acyl-CoA transferase